VISNLVPGARDLGGNGGQAVHMCAALEERGCGSEFREYFQEFGRAFVGSVIERKRHGTAVARPSPDRWPKHGG
jgi:hypothetical protein